MSRKSAGLKHRSQVRSGHRSGHRSGQVAGQVTGEVNRKNIFLPRKLPIFLGYTKIWFYQGPPYRDFWGRTSYLLLGLYHASVK